MGIGGIDTVRHFRVLMHPCSCIRNRLGDVECVPFGKPDTLLDRIDLQLTGCMDELHFELRAFTTDDRHYFHLLSALHYTSAYAIRLPLKIPKIAAAYAAEKEDPDKPEDLARQAGQITDKGLN